MTHQDNDDFFDLPILFSHQLALFGLRLQNEKSQLSQLTIFLNCLIGLDLAVGWAQIFVPANASTEHLFIYFPDLGYFGLGLEHRLLLAMPAVLLRSMAFALLVYHSASSFDWLYQAKRDLGNFGDRLNLNVSLGGLIAHLRLIILLGLVMQVSYIVSFLAMGIMFTLKFHFYFLFSWLYLTIIYTLPMYILLVTVGNYYLLIRVALSYLVQLESCFRRSLVSRASHEAETSHKLTKLVPKLVKDFLGLYLVVYRLITYQRTVYLIFATSILIITIPLYNLAYTNDLPTIVRIAATLCIIFINGLVVVLEMLSGQIDRRAKRFSTLIYYRLFIARLGGSKNSGETRAQMAARILELRDWKLIDWPIRNYFRITETDYIGLTVLGYPIDTSSIVTFYTLFFTAMSLMF